MAIRIERTGLESAPLVLQWVQELLLELGEEGDELGELNQDQVLRAWRTMEGHIWNLIARDAVQQIVGIATVVESFAIYAGGNYGIINEMYVAPAYRSQGVGADLIEAVKNLGKDRGWRRIDVAAPESERWSRTRQFYERQGFVFTGPKLKLLLQADG